MAASRPGSPMRDQRRVDDNTRDSQRHRNRSTRERRKSPAAPQRPRDTDLELKIKGRAATDSVPASPHKNKRVEATRSPKRLKPRSEEQDRRRPESNKDRHRARDRHQNKSDQKGRGRTNRSRSPAFEVYDFRDKARRTRSPVFSGRGDSFRPSSRHRARSPPRPGQYFSSYPETSGLAGRHGDSYVPRSYRRPATPPPRRRSRSGERLPRSRRSSPRHPRRAHSPIRSSRRDPAGPDLDVTSPHPASPSKRHKVSARYRASPHSHSPNTSDPRTGRPRSPSPARRERGRGARTKMQPSTRPIQSILDDGTRQPSPPRRIPSYDSSQQNPALISQQFPLHGMKASDVHGANRGNRPPQLNTQHSYNTSPQWTPTSSHHGSPHSASPYGQSRGGWGNQSHQYQGQSGANAYSPPFRQNSYSAQQSPQAQYYNNGQQSPFGAQQQMQPAYAQNLPQRGGQSNYRGSHYGQVSDRRISNPGPPPAAFGRTPTTSRARTGLFQNLQWTANPGSGRGRSDSEQATHTPHLQTSPPHHSETTREEEDSNPFRPSKDLQVEDQIEKEKRMPPPRQGSDTSSKEGPKISFSIKGKGAIVTSIKSPPDLTRKMQEGPKKENPLDVSNAKKAPRLSEVKERDKREERRDRHRRDDRRDDRDYRDRRDQQRGGYRDDRRSERDHKLDRRERSPEIIRRKEIIRKPCRALSPTFAGSTSVYYRKPGNESVVGSGTYGKVFKAIHVYTQNYAALKKIRMDGEKDGFPVTAVREIKLLQSLKHENVVSLQEVMVEHNDCFMVFEYLSHDLTGLLNHPTFKLEDAHRKHLSRQLFEGLNYLHKRGVLHRDIKAANILVSDTGQLKLADFGLARFFSKRGKPDYTNRVITIWYRSPELLLGETQYGPAVDIWSAACVMVEIFTRHAIFPGDGGEINQLDKIYNVLGTPTRSEWPGLVDMAWFELLRPTEKRSNTFKDKYGEKLTPDAFELLQAMFMYDPAKRPTAADVLEHSYFVTENPPPRQVVELKQLAGDWHEFESKALRKEQERKNQEARRAVRQEEHEKEKAKRKAGGPITERSPKRQRPDSGQGDTRSK